MKIEIEMKISNFEQLYENQQERGKTKCLFL